MASTKLRPAYILSIIVTFLAATASAVGLFSSDLYRDNSIVEAAWAGNDWVTLVIAVPVLLTALLFSWRGSLRAQLVWLGMLDYMLYNYAFYLFGAAFNRFFLVYVLLFTLSMYALIFGLVKMDTADIGQEGVGKTAVKFISGFMLIEALGLTTVYLIQSLNFVTTGQLPSILAIVDHPTSVIFALDLSLVVPVLLLGAIWLWQGRAWGYLLAVIANVKGAIYLFALAASSYTAAQVGAAEAGSQIPLWLTLSMGSLLASLLLLGKLNLQKTKQPIGFRPQEAT